MGSKLKNLLKARVGAAAQQQPSAPAATGVKRARQEKNQRAGKAAKQRKAVHRANRGSNTSHARADAQRRARQREDAPDALAEELQVGKLVGTEGSAYTALLGALSSSSSALRHRQVEQEGDSAGEESESDEGEGQEGEEAEGVDAADGDEDGDEVDDLAKLSTAELEALLAEEEGERAEGQTNIGEQDDEGSMGGSDGEDEGRAVAVDTWSRKGLQAAKTTPAVTKQDAAAASRAAAAAATAAAADAPDTFAQHMTRELSDSDKVALQGARPKPQDAPETPVYQVRPLCPPA